ncbi:cytochrome c4 [mine drainage metagenome]|uniref:Cytochrome c4 n=1 Tax=mine drainage metagenome TaxID=410659 RepID=A0A1J5RV17_9ZZZZ
MNMMKRSLLVTIGASLAAVAIGAVAATPAQVDPAKGKAIASTVCVACHGADGNSVIATNPKLAGQGAAYIYKQLSNFKSENGKPPVRVNPIMNGMAASLSDADMKSLGAYFASQVRKPEVAKDQDSVELGQKLYRGGDADTGIPACAACHGPTGAGLPVQYPRLSGQFADYTEAQLQAFRSGTRANDPNKMMRTIALRMTDPQIKALSDYIAGLR